jgi:hypothetical protein
MQGVHRRLVESLFVLAVLFVLVPVMAVAGALILWWQARRR